MRILLLVWAGFASGLTSAQTPPTSHWHLEVGWGHEAQSAPLFQLSPDSTVVYQEGVDRLSGSHGRTALGGAIEWLAADGTVASLAGDATFKRSPGTPGFDLGAVSVQPSVHRPWGRSSVGLGLHLQRLDVAGQHFRDAVGVEASWTLATGDGLWGIVLESSSAQHGVDLSDLDAASHSVVVLRQLSNPVPGVEGIDFSAIAGREVNRRGLPELSQRSAMVTASLRWTGWGVHFSAGRSWRVSVFDGTAFPGEPLREDRTTMLDLAAQMPVGANQSLRLEFNEARNVSTSALYDNLYHQISVTMRTSF